MDIDDPTEGPVGTDSFPMKCSQTSVANLIHDEKRNGEKNDEGADLCVDSGYTSNNMNCDNIVH